MAALEPLLVSQRDAATALGNISTRTVRRLIQQKRITARKLGKLTLVDYSSLRAYAQSLPVKSHATPLFGERAHVRPTSRPR